MQLERPDAVPIEEQLEMLSGLMQKGKVCWFVFLRTINLQSGEWV